MKVLHLVHDVQSDASGPSYSVPMLIRSQERMGLDVHLVSTKRGSKKSVIRSSKHLVFAREFDAIPLLGKLGLSVSLWNYLWRNLGQYDVVHVHGMWLLVTLYPFLLRFRGNFKIVLSPRGMLDPAALGFSPWKKKLAWHVFQRFALKNADGFHATSQIERRDIQAHLPASIVCVAANGIEVKEVNVVGSKEDTVLYIGRIHPKKGVALLVEAWARLGSLTQGWTLAIYGPSELGEEERLKNLSNALALKNIKFGGPIYGEEKARAYKNAAVFALPTYGENFGITVAESLAHGTPVICSVKTPWNDLDERGCGWSISPNADELESALRP